MAMKTVADFRLIPNGTLGIHKFLGNVLYAKLDNGHVMIIYDATEPPGVLDCFVVNNNGIRRWCEEMIEWFIYA